MIQDKDLRNYKLILAINVCMSGFYSTFPNSLLLKISHDIFHCTNMKPCQVSSLLISPPSIWVTISGQGADLAEMPWIVAWWLLPLTMRHFSFIFIQGSSSQTSNHVPRSQFVIWLSNLIPLDTDLLNCRKTADKNASANIKNSLCEEYYISRLALVKVVFTFI